MAVSILGQVDDRFIWNTFNSNDMVWLARFRIGLNSAGAGKRQASELLMSENPSGISRLVVFGDSLSDNGNLFRLIGEPQPPYFDGRFSNGPTYAEQLAASLDVPLQDLAFGGATASDLSPGLLTNSQTGQPLPINLPEQVAGYLAGLKGGRAKDDTTAVIYVGNNDYLNYLESNLPKDLPTAQGIVTNVITSIGQAIGETEHSGGGEDRALHLGGSGDHAGNSRRSRQVAGFAGFTAHELDLLNNAALRISPRAIRMSSSSICSS